MTDKVNTLIVVLEMPLRDDIAEEVARVIGRIRGVAHVKLGPAANFADDYATRVRCAQLLRDRVWAWAEELKGG
jgi:hypothetical protein